MNRSKHEHEHQHKNTEGSALELDHIDVWNGIRGHNTWINMVSTSVPAILIGEVRKSARIFEACEQMFIYVGLLRIHP